MYQLHLHLPWIQYCLEDLAYQEFLVFLEDQEGLVDQEALGVQVVLVVQSDQAQYKVYWGAVGSFYCYYYLSL
jgi:hypothetical protein